MTTKPLTFELYQDERNDWRWRARDTRENDDPILADSGEGYPTRAAALTALQRIRTHAQDAAIHDLASARVTEFRRDITVEMAEGGE